jgi:hypothetical protein
MRSSARPLAVMAYCLRWRIRAGLTQRAVTRRGGVPARLRGDRAGRRRIGSKYASARPIPCAVYPECFRGW